MTREEQRIIGAARLSANRLRDGGMSTLVATSHLSADYMALFVADGGESFKDYNAAQRRQMAKEGRAMPDGSFPIADCADAEDAIRSQGRGNPANRDAVRAFIKKRVTSLNCSGTIFDKYK